jgi:hypothetical protein
MAATRTPFEVFTGTVTGGSGDTTSIVYTIPFPGYAIMTLVIETLTTPPTQPAMIQVQCSFGENTPLYTTVYTFQGSKVANDKITQNTLYIPVGIRFFRVVRSAGSDQNVLMDIRGSLITY